MFAIVVFGGSLGLGGAVGLSHELYIIIETNNKIPKIILGAIFMLRFPFSFQQ
jgi:hypothetical protein